jgi:hypothetical protein
VNPLKKLLNKWRAYRLLVQRKKYLASVLQNKLGGVHFIERDDALKAGWIGDIWNNTEINFAYVVEFKYSTVRLLSAEISYFGQYKVLTETICKKMGRMAHYYGFDEVYFTFVGKKLSYRYKKGVLKEIDLTPD